MALLPIVALGTTESWSQQPAPALQRHAPAITVDVREVVVDVAAYSGNGFFSRGEPLRGLRQEDFQIFENGKPQTLRSFSTHEAAAPEEGKTERTGPLTQGSKAGLSVILIDQASLGFDLQPWLLTQLTDFLKTAPEASPIALFAVSPRLRLVHGFTTDHAQLIAALQAKGLGIHAQPSPFLQTQDEADQAKEAPAALREEQVAHGGNYAAMAEQLERLQQGMSDTETMLRTSNTLAAFQQLARYLASFPDRKSLLWVSSTFTDRPFGMDTEPDPEFRFTTDMLQAARVAVYPIDGSGLSAPNLPHAAASVAGIYDARTATAALASARTEESLNRNRTRETMEKVATRTGGEAFYNTNGIAAAMQRVVRQANSYYTLVYTSTAQENGADYARIHVQLKGQHGTYHLSYKPGYFLQEASALKQGAVDNAALEPYMDPSMPNVTQVRFRLAARRAPASPEGVAATSAISNSRRTRSGSQHLLIDLAIPMHELKFVPDAGGQRADFLVAVAAYDEHGHLAGRDGARYSPSLATEAMQRGSRTGFQLTQALDLPPGRYLLRTGVYDLQTLHVGTVDSALPVAP